MRLHLAYFIAILAITALFLWNGGTINVLAAVLIATGAHPFFAHIKEAILHEVVRDLLPQKHPDTPQSERAVRDLL